jgi:hypothetical protein
VYFSGKPGHLAASLQGVGGPHACSVDVRSRSFPLVPDCSNAKFLLPIQHLETIVALRALNVAAITMLRSTLRHTTTTDSLLAVWWVVCRGFLLVGAEAELIESLRGGRLG